MTKDELQKIQNEWIEKARWARACGDDNLFERFQKKWLDVTKAYFSEEARDLKNEFWQNFEGLITDDGEYENLLDVKAFEAPDFNKIQLNDEGRQSFLKDFYNPLLSKLKGPELEILSKLLEPLSKKEDGLLDNHNEPGIYEILLRYQHYQQLKNNLLLIGQNTLVDLLETYAKQLYFPPDGIVDFSKIEDYAAYIQCLDFIFQKSLDHYKLEGLKSPAAKIFYLNKVLPQYKEQLNDHGFDGEKLLKSAIAWRAKSSDEEQKMLFTKVAGASEAKFEVDESNSRIESVSKSYVPDTQSNDFEDQYSAWKMAPWSESFKRETTPSLVDELYEITNKYAKANQEKD